MSRRETMSTMHLPHAWTPTHRLMWTDQDGERHHADVRIVHHADASGPVFLAFTRDDDTFELWPTWRLRPGDGSTLEAYRD